MQHKWKTERCESFEIRPHHDIMYEKRMRLCEVEETPLGIRH